MRGLFQATLEEELKDKAEDFLFSLFKEIFRFEAERQYPSPTLQSPRQLLPLLASLLEGLVITLARAEASELQHFTDLQLKIVSMAKETIEKHHKPISPRGDLWAIVMHALASRYCTQCYNEHWSRKTGGWVGIDMLVRRTNLGSIWAREHQLEIIRALLFMLKDMPGDPPGNSDQVGDTLIYVLEVANARQKTTSEDAEDMEVDGAIGASAASNPTAGGFKTSEKEPSTEKRTEKSIAPPSAANGSAKPAEESASKPTEKDSTSAETTEKTEAKAVVEKGKEPQPAGKRQLTAEEQERILVERQFSFLVGILVQELSSANELVRAVTQRAFRLLAKIRGCSATEILAPVKDRLLGPIFSKPLRALPFGMQIGHIDAITFCLQLEPPLPEFNEELYRVLTEALALADSEDAALVGRTSQYKNMLALTNLRVASIRLLSASLACNDFLTTKQAQMRMKIISVYFKSLYSRSEAVVEVAHAALKSTLQSQSKVSFPVSMPAPSTHARTWSAAPERCSAKWSEADSDDAR